MPPDPQNRTPSNPRRSAGLRRRVARARLVGLCGLGLLGVVACGPDVAPTPSGVPAAATAAAPSSPSGTATAALPSPGGAAVGATPGSTSGPTSGTAAPAGRCRSDGLAARFAPWPDDRGAHRVAVVWTNTTDRPCTMTGFGGVDLHGPDVPTVGPTFSLRRSAERPATITLAPHATALTVIHYVSPGAAGPRWTPTSALVTPPDETRSVPLAWTLGPVLRQDGATRPGTFLSPVQPPVPSPVPPPDRSGPTTCRPDQVTAAVVVGDAAASHRDARLELSARRGQSCRVAGPLAVGVRSAGRVPVRGDGRGGPAAVQLDATHRASSTLQWTVAADRPITPQALTVTLPGGPVEVRWTFGPVDPAPTRGIAVGPLTGGTAPR